MHIHSGHAALLLAWPPRVPKRRGQQRGCKDERQHHSVLERELKGPMLFFVCSKSSIECWHWLDDTATHNRLQREMWVSVTPEKRLTTPSGASHHGLVCWIVY